MNLWCFLTLILLNKLHTSTLSFRESFPNITDISDVVRQYPHPVIIDGYFASIDEFPYAIRLYIQINGNIISCTGQAIHKKLVITAAHCVHRGGEMLVVTGNANQDDYIKGKNLYKYARYGVTHAFVHPGFDVERLIHDVALIKLNRDFAHPGSALINISYERIVKPERATIFGWGGTESDKRNNKLFAKGLMIENCTFRPNFNHTYLCLMEKGICHGDSGGGLVINGSLFGIASFHDEAGPGVCSDKHTYYYTALSEEETFLRDCVLKNESSQDWTIHFLIWGLLLVTPVIKII